MLVLLFWLILFLGKSLKNTSSKVLGSIPCHGCFFFGGGGLARNFQS